MTQRIGPCRYLAASKPRKEREEVEFYRCTKCGRLLTGWPSQGGQPHCCGQEMKRLIPGGPAERDILDYEILGGPNENAVRVTWEKRPEWLYLETFRGRQLIFPDPRDRKAVFALAGKDAYAYCDKDPCVECCFRCKHGFILYAFWAEEGLAALPLNRISTASTRGGYTTKTPSQSQ